MENGPHGLPFSIPHQYSRKATVSSDTVAFIALFLINQLIQLGGSFNSLAGTSVIILTGILIPSITNAKISDVFPLMYAALFKILI